MGQMFLMGGGGPVRTLRTVETETVEPNGMKVKTISVHPDDIEDVRSDMDRRLTGRAE